MDNERFQQWRQGVTKNRSGDMANLFGLAEAIGRQNSAQRANVGSGDIIAQMLGGMQPQQPVPASMMIPGGGPTPATWMRQPTGGLDAADLDAKLGIVGGAEYRGQGWADQATAADSAYKARRAAALADLFR